MTDLKDWIKTSSKFVEVLFDKQGGTFHGMLHVVSADGERVMNTPPARNKDVGVKLIRELLKKFKATRVLYMDEAWVILAAPDYKPDGSSLEHHPDRTEQIIFIAEDVNEGTVMASRTIRRDGKKAALEPLEFKDMVSGRLAGLLPVKGQGH